MPAFDAQEELAFIKKIMDDTQKVLIDNGKIYILWSALAIIAIILKLVKEELNIMINNLWLYIPVLVVGSIISYFLKKKVDMQIPVKKITNRILKGMWSGFAVTVTILVVIGYISGSVNSWAIPSIIAALIGSIHYSSGIVLQNRLIMYSAPAWWTYAVVTLFWPGAYMVPMLAVMFFVFQFLPAVLLYRRWKNDISVGN
jgi:drug/metabolite transporter (DMT)-like permease